MVLQINSGCGRARSIRAWNRTAALGGLLVIVLWVSARTSAAQSAALTTECAAQQNQPLLSGQRAEHPGLPAATNEIAYWYGPDYRTPFVVSGAGKAAAIARNALEYTHASFWALGSTFADVMVNQSNMVEPAAGGGVGATELYATLRSDVGLKEATGSAAFGNGPLRDVSIELGANLETKNSSYAPGERTLYFGPKFQFAMPKGYFNVGVHLRKEWNHEGVLGRSENYDPDFNIEPTWLLPFRVGNTHLAYTGFADYNTQKGKDSFGSATAAEFLVRNYVAVDIGGLLLHKSRVLDLNCGFWYWHNEYGKPWSDAGASQMTPMFGMTFHFEGVRVNRGR